MTNKYAKKCSTSLNISEMHIKTPVIYCLSPIRMAIIKRAKINSGKDMEKENSCTACVNVN
jgi:hypothetical protein